MNESELISPEHRSHYYPGDKVSRKINNLKYRLSNRFMSAGFVLGFAITGCSSEIDEQVDEQIHQESDDMESELVRSDSEEYLQELSEYNPAPMTSRDPSKLLEQYRINADCLINARVLQLQLECAELIHGGNPGTVREFFDEVAVKSHEQRLAFGPNRQNRLVDVRVTDTSQDMNEPIEDNFVEFFVAEVFENEAETHSRIAFRRDDVDYDNDIVESWIITSTGPGNKD